MSLITRVDALKKINLTKTQKKVFLGVGIALVLIVIPYILIQAKFMKKANAKSVSTASGFYFSSNKLNEVDYRDSIDEETDVDQVEYVIEGWDGKSPVDFDFDLRDYENPLLYNNDNQIVEYKIYYKVVTEDEKVDVTLSTGDQTLTSGVVEKLDKDSISGEDESKRYNSKNYTLQVKSKDGYERVEDFKVELYVQTTTNSPYQRALGATVIFKYTKSESYLEEAGFRVTPGSDVDLEDKSVNKEHYTLEGNKITDNDYALVYGIGTTVGSSMLKSDTSNAVTKLHYTWNNEKIGFDRFNDLNQGISLTASKLEVAVLGETFLDLKNDDSDEKVLVTKDNMSQFLNVIIIDKDSNTGHLFFDTVAYSYYTLIMYKKDVSIKPSEANENKYASVEEVKNQ